MKLNQWTIGLAAVGLVSMGSAVQAEEKANAVQTALAATTISGYVDTSAEYNFGTPTERLPAYKFNGQNKADGFNLDVVQLRIDKALDEEQWSAGYRVDLWFGPDANVLGTTSTGLNTSDFAIRQAYLALRTPVGNGIDWKVGVFDAILGYESVDAGSDPNFTRTYGHTIEPQTQTGMVGTYHLCEHFTFSAGVANTLGPTIDNRSYPPDQRGSLTWMGSIAWTAPENLGFLAGSTVYAGIVNGFSNRVIPTDPTDPTVVSQNNAVNYYVGTTLATPVTGLRCGAAFDLLNVHDLSGETYALAGYTSYQASEKLSFHGRMEYFKDRGAQKFSVAQGINDVGDTVTYQTNPDAVLAMTATVQYDLWKNVISRLELRWDHSLKGYGTWGAANPTTLQGSLLNSWLLGANLIYRF